MIMGIWPKVIQPVCLSLNDILDCGVIQHVSILKKKDTLYTQLVFRL